MAVVFEGFSIREYAAKKRSVDIAKCWPFGGDSDSISDEKKREVIEPLLPPITVTKFRWWSHELELLKSKEDENEESSSAVEEIPQDITRNYDDDDDDDAEKLETVCPVFRQFAGGTVNVVNAHVDSCLAEASREERRRQLTLAVKGKSRQPKKRSIVEIFAVSQQIQKVDVDADDDENLDAVDGQEDEMNSKSETKKKKKKKKKKKVKKVKVVNKLIINNKTNKKDKLKKINKMVQRRDATVV